MKIDTLLATVKCALRQVDAIERDGLEAETLVESINSISIVPESTETVLVSVHRNDGSVDLVQASPKGGEPTALILGRAAVEALGLGGRRG